MDTADTIFSHFQGLNDLQKEKFNQLKPLYVEWNLKINVISRKDIDHFYERHVLHSLMIAMCGCVTDSRHILDIGTGGGFPGIPLAIMYPEKKFVLVDSIKKKIGVVKDVATRLELKNIDCFWQRAEETKGNYDTMVSRAVSSTSKLIDWVSQIKTLKKMILLKGGDLSAELSDIKQNYSILDLKDKSTDEFFKTKKIVLIKR